MKQKKPIISAVLLGLIILGCIAILFNFLLKSVNTLASSG